LTIYPPLGCKNILALFKARNAVYRNGLAVKFTIRAVNRVQILAQVAAKSQKFS